MAASASSGIETTCSVESEPSNGTFLNTQKDLLKLQTLCDMKHDWLGGRVDPTVKDKITKFLKEKLGVIGEKGLTEEAFEKFLLQKFRDHFGLPEVAQEYRDLPPVFALREPHRIIVRKNETKDGKTGYPLYGNTFQEHLGKWIHDACGQDVHVVIDAVPVKKRQKIFSTDYMREIPVKGSLTNLTDQASSGLDKEQVILDKRLHPEQTIDGEHIDTTTVSFFSGYKPICISYKDEKIQVQVGDVTFKFPKEMRTSPSLYILSLVLKHKLGTKWDAFQTLARRQGIAKASDFSRAPVKGLDVEIEAALLDGFHRVDKETSVELALHLKLLGDMGQNRYAGSIGGIGCTVDRLSALGFLTHGAKGVCRAVGMKDNSFAEFMFPKPGSPPIPTTLSNAIKVVRAVGEKAKQVEDIFQEFREFVSKSAAGASVSAEAKHMLSKRPNFSSSRTMHPRAPLRVPNTLDLVKGNTYTYTFTVEEEEEAEEKGVFEGVEQAEETETYRFTNGTYPKDSLSYIRPFISTYTYLWNIVTGQGQGQEQDQEQDQGQEGQTGGWSNKRTCKRKKRSKGSKRRSTEKNRRVKGGGPMNMEASEAREATQGQASEATQGQAIEMCEMLLSLLCANLVSTLRSFPEIPTLEERKDENVPLDVYDTLKEKASPLLDVLYSPYIDVSGNAYIEEELEDSTGDAIDNTSLRIPYRSILSTLFTTLSENKDNWEHIPSILTDFLFVHNYSEDHPVSKYVSNMKSESDFQTVVQALNSFWNGSGPFLWETPPETIEDFNAYVTFLQGQEEGQEETQTVFMEEEDTPARTPVAIPMYTEKTIFDSPTRRKGPIVPLVFGTPSPRRDPESSSAPSATPTPRLKVPRFRFGLPEEGEGEAEENNTTGGSMTQKKKRRHPKRSNRRKYNNRTTYKRRKSRVVPQEGKEITESSS